MVRIGSVGLVICCFCSAAYAGPYSPGAGQPGSTAIAASDPLITGWANGVADLTRGPINISNPSGGLASFGTGANALGPSDAATNFSGIVSLGDGGQITLTFPHAIRNGPGPDFSPVFENGFASSGSYFLELGFVEVSSDGTNFFRFPSVSLTPTATQTGPFDLTDPTNLYDLAGNFEAGYGTPFDLQELAGISPQLDVNDIQYVRVVDVVGSINPLYATHDSLGNIINDPWPTSGSTSGFDLDAIGEINAVPEPSGIALAGLAAIAFGFGYSVTRRRPRLHATAV